jgi:sterol desaturase/sphingolipid hydroxylase (fatty acid hydroxylase superfamily)
MSVAVRCAFWQAIGAALILMLSHCICVGIVMYFDFSGKWEAYELSKSRSKSLSDRMYDYQIGIRKFCLDLVLLFVPCIAFCFWCKGDKIADSPDSMFLSFVKLLTGYALGKIWAFLVHYGLHFPLFYQFHRRHHRNPKNLVASAAWDDSFVEYAIMEIPSFAITLLLFPTHYYWHLIHFAWHGWDGACGHSGFAAPGLLGACFNGEYHYHHHALLTVNYAELEFLDKLCGTHHSQRSVGVNKQTLSSTRSQQKTNNRILN